MGDAISPWRYSSKRAVNDLLYFGRRYYSPKLGRWITPDPAGYTDEMNLYAYVNNDPLTHFDEYALWDEWGIGSTAWTQNQNLYPMYRRGLQDLNRSAGSFVSRVAHESYDYFLAPMIRELSFHRLEEFTARKFVPSMRLSSMAPEIRI